MYRLSVISPSFSILFSLRLSLPSWVAVGSFISCPYRWLCPVSLSFWCCSRPSSSSLWHSLCQPTESPHPPGSPAPSGPSSVLRSGCLWVAWHASGCHTLRTRTSCPGMVLQNSHVCASTIQLAILKGIVLLTVMRSSPLCMRHRTWQWTPCHGLHSHYMAMISMQKITEFGTSTLQELPHKLPIASNPPLLSTPSAMSKMASSQRGTLLGQPQRVDCNSQLI